LKDTLKQRAEKKAVEKTAKKAAWKDLNLEEFISYIQSAPAYPYKPPKPPKHYELKKQTLVVKLSDLHMGQTVKGYQT
jgi:sRNA-binding protein